MLLSANNIREREVPVKGDFNGELPIVNGQLITDGGGWEESGEKWGYGRFFVLEASYDQHIFTAGRFGGQTCQDRGNRTSDDFFVLLGELPGNDDISLSERFSDLSESLENTMR